MAQRNGSTRAWRRLVAEVVARDHGICHVCLGPEADSADHDPIPKAAGGPDTLANLKAIHHNTPPHCNRYKGETTADAARRYMTSLGLLNPTTDDWDW